MKTNKIIWGILLLFMGSVLLLENFDVIEFYWRNVWQFWPLFLIISGVAMLFKNRENNISTYISVSILIISLLFLFYKGQQKPKESNWFDKNFEDGIDINIDDKPQVKEFLFEPFDGDTTKKVIFNITGGGTSFYLDGETDSLVFADISRKKGRFILSSVKTATENTVNFKMKEKNHRLNFGGNQNDVNLKLNTKPIWDFNVKLGAGEFKFDMTNYKVNTFNFEGGASEVDLNIGSLLPNSYVNIQSGVAAIDIAIPAQSGCRIKTNTGLSSKDFEGFTKMENGFYETDDFEKAKNKIYINLDGGLSRFQVHRD
ncbi:MAG: DUF5668 domain-containing protein [Sphingobacteriaceae bacterium]|nr:DUF5668 domain-containing protein [Sphingobacteriaceae bacterium]